MSRVFACSDLHGQYNLWKQIKEYCEEDDTIFFLGDAIDRGEDNLQTLIELLEDKRVIFLKGNHEAMLQDNYKEIFSNGFSPSLWLWECNGGENSIKAFKKMSLEKRKWLIDKIKNLPTFAFYKNDKGQTIYLSHAGGMAGYPQDENDRIWDRSHFNDSWDEKEYPNHVSVHGHTPVQSLLTFLNFEQSKERAINPIIVKYANNHKIDIDLGTFATHKVALLDLDTLEPIYFTQKEEKTNE